MKVKTEDLTGPAFDWAVAKAEGYFDKIVRFPNGANCKYAYVDGPHGVALMTTGHWWFRPSTDWAQGGPIIEREGILNGPSPFPGDGFAAGIGSEWGAAKYIQQGPTP